MKKFILLSALAGLHVFVFSQSTDSLEYNKASYMIPMRDGIQLNTVVLTPANQNASYPFLIVRTPYGVDENFPNGNQVIKLSRNFQFLNMATDGYIFVFQDIRGKYKSQGNMEIHQPLVHQSKKGAVDESTDTWDTIEWLLHNIKNNNGKAGITGISYPGWLALVGARGSSPRIEGFFRTGLHG